MMNDDRPSPFDMANKQSLEIGSLDDLSDVPKRQNPTQQHQYSDQGATSPHKRTFRPGAIPIQGIGKTVFTLLALAADSFEQPDRAMSDPSPATPNASHHSHKHFAHVQDSFHHSLHNLPQYWSPDLHSNPHIASHPHARWHDYRQSRDKLFVNGFSQLLVTCVLVGVLVAILDAYSLKHALDTSQKHAFNALITGCSIALGINLASSLRSYATLLRWRLLASAWLTLEEFDLVLSCASQVKTLKLLFISKLKRRFPFVSLIQFLCVLWVFLNIGVQVLVAMIGLTYSLQLSTWDLHRSGWISVVNLSSITDPYGGESSFGAQQFAGHAFGIQGQDYDLLPLPDPVTKTFKHAETKTVWANYTGPDSNDAIYWFTDINANETTVTAKAERSITANVSCYAYNLFQFDPNDFTQSLFNYSDGTQNQSVPIREWLPGAVTYFSSTDNEYCGPRCTRVFAFQAQQKEDYVNEQLDVSKATLFDCNNTITQVTDGPPETHMPDEQAQIIAGAIGWTGYSTTNTSVGHDLTSQYQYNLYSPESQWSPGENMQIYGEWSAAALIGQFSMYAVAAMDDNGPRINISTSHQPERTERVIVEWKWAIVLLAVIPAIQFTALLAVVLWANKAVIKDDSFLAAARLLKPLVDRLEDTGSVLTGKEIAQAIRQRSGNGEDLRIFYGFRPSEGDAQGYMKVDIIEKGHGLEPKLNRTFVKGHYL